MAVLYCLSGLAIIITCTLVYTSRVPIKAESKRRDND